MKNHTIAAAVLGLMITQAAAAETLPAWLTERRIIGNNDLEPIEAALGSDVYEKARIVARVESADGSGFCTASRVGKDLFLTNFHCYDYEPCETIQFHLGYEKALAPEEQKIFRCKEVLASDLNLDYALYRVEPAGAPSSGLTLTHDFVDLALDIPDNDATGVEKSFDLVQEGKLLDLTLHIRLNHSFVGDLKLELVSPAGTTIVFRDQVGGAQQDLDQTFGFEGGLRVLAGEQVTGAWKLVVRDLAAEDTGKLESVSFTITTEAPVDGDPIESFVVEEGDFPLATLWAGPIAVDQPLLVASHPAARLKELDRSATCKLRTIETEIVSERTTITHTCDTEGGSSGSPVLDRETGYVVALHWGGLDGYNLAIPMSLVVKSFEEKLSPEVLSELSIKR